MELRDPATPGELGHLPVQCGRGGVGQSLRILNRRGLAELVRCHQSGFLGRSRPDRLTVFWWIEDGSFHVEPSG